MEELKFKNALFAVLYGACFTSASVIFACIYGIIFTYIFENARDFTLVIIIGALVLLSIWVIACLIIILNNTVMVTSDEIKMCRGKKVVWIMQREKIEECIYTQIKWYDFLIPISAINAFALQFRLKENNTISNKFCSLSLKQVKKIIQTFNYLIRTINTIHQQ